MGASDHPYSSLSAPRKPGNTQTVVSPPSQTLTSDQPEAVDAPKKTGRGSGATIPMAVPYNRALRPKGNASHPGAQRLCKRWSYDWGWWGGGGVETPALGELWVN